MNIIGGADESTSILLTNNFSFGWGNAFGLIIVLLMLIPNIVYAIKEKDQKNLCQNKAMNILEQIGRYGCMFCMIFNNAFVDFGFKSENAFIIYLLGNIILILLYLISWVLYFKSKRYWKQLVLAIIPTCLFLLNGLTMLNYLLILFSVIFGISHIYITTKNKVE